MQFKSLSSTTSRELRKQFPTCSGRECQWYIHAGNGWRVVSATLQTVRYGLLPPSLLIAFRVLVHLLLFWLIGCRPAQHVSWPDASDLVNSLKVNVPRHLNCLQDGIISRMDLQRQHSLTPCYPRGLGPSQSNMLKLIVIWRLQTISTL